MKRNLLLQGEPFGMLANDQVDRLMTRKELNVFDHRGKTAKDPALLKDLKECEMAITGNLLVFDDALLSQLPKLKIIAKMGVGLDMIDIPACTKHKVMVCNTPGANSVAVAEHTFALLLGLLRQVVRCETGMRNGIWEQTKIMGKEICNKVVGIVGMGDIGRQVARRMVGFDAKVIGFDPYWPEEFAKKWGIERKTLDEILAESDYVCVHCPLTKDTANFINKSNLKLMKPDAYLVNMARGGIVKDEDLYEVLVNKKIAGAVLDAFAQEPPVDPLPFVNLDNVILSPHVGAFTSDAMRNMESGCVDQIFGYLEGINPRNLRNPDVLK